MNEVPNHHRDQQLSLPRSQKRVRTSDPDLKIIFKGGQGEGEAERIFECHSIIMATHSGYFDALVSNGMQESNEKSVTLQDVDPKVFELAMKLLENPLTAVECTSEKAIQVASFYNRFDFACGLELVTSILGKFLDHWTETTQKSPLQHEKDTLIETIRFSEESSNTRLIQKSNNFLTVKFCQNDNCGMGIFDLEDIEEIQHFLGHGGSRCVEAFYTDFINFDHPTQWQILDSGFPRRLISYFQCLLGYALCQKVMLDKVKVTFHGKKKNGRKFELSQVLSSFWSVLKDKWEIGFWQYRLRDRDGEISLALWRVNENDWLCFDDDLNCDELVNDCQMGDWVLHCRLNDEEEYNFLSPMSRNQPLPPLEGGWVQVYHEDHEQERLANFTPLKLNTYLAIARASQ